MVHSTMQTLKNLMNGDILIVSMRLFTFLVFFVAGFGLWAESLPEWMIPLREALYEEQQSADQIMPLFTRTKAEAERNLSGTALDLALSRASLFIGRAFLTEERNEEARSHFAEGLRLAEKAVAAAPSAEAWVLRAENLSYLCQIGPWTFTAANGLDVEKFAKNALAIDSRNAAAQYLIAARWVFAPAPFNNLKKGIDMMKDIEQNGDMEKTDRFNVYSAIGYGYIQQKKFDEAKPWLQKALEIYPTNKFAAELLDNATNKRR
jgi:tetratricopeptide (TPR) repeat protein